MVNAQEILDLHKLWKEADANTLADKISNVLIDEGIDAFYDRLDKLAKITDTSSDAAYAWLNHGRENVKIPFHKLCKFAAYYHLDLENLLRTKPYTRKVQFVVAKVRGNDWEYLKYFDEDAKEEAIQYAEETHKKDPNTTVCAIKGVIDENGEPVDHTFEVFHSIKAQAKQKEIVSAKK